MSNRSLFLGIAVILAAGAAAWLLVRPEGATRDTSRSPGITVPEGMRLESDRAVRDTRPDSMHTLDPGEVAPNFKLESLLGDSLELTAQRGRVVVLNFWATWCQPCREEMPDLHMTQNALEAAGVIVVGISLDEEGRDVVAPFHETFPVDYPLLLDGLDVARLYGAHYVVPTTFVIGRDGRVVHRFEGALTFEELLPRVRELAQQVE